MTPDEKPAGVRYGRWITLALDFDAFHRGVYTTLSLPTEDRDRMAALLRARLHMLRKLDRFTIEKVLKDMVARPDWQMLA